MLAVAGEAPLKVAVITTSFAAWLCCSGVIIILPGAPFVRVSVDALRDTLPAGEAESCTVPEAPWRMICPGIVCPRMVMSSLVAGVLLMLIVKLGAATAKGLSLLAFPLDSWADARNAAPESSAETTTWR
jgi:hypothetical protein